MNPVVMCAHCGRIGYSDRGWGRTCKLHAIKTYEENIIRHQNRKTAVFYDPDPNIVEKERNGWNYASAD